MLQQIEVEVMHGRDFVRQLNGALGERTYHDDVFKGMTGVEVGSLWDAYKASLEEDKKAKASASDGRGDGSGKPGSGVR